MRADTRQIIVRFSTLITLIATSLALLAPSRAAEATRETRSLAEPFDAIRLAGDLDLQLVQGDSPGVVLEADPRLLEHIKTQVRGSTLEIRYEGVHIQFLSHTTPKVILTAKSLRRIMAQGSGDIRADSWNAASGLELALSGASDVRIHGLTAPKISVHVSGSGDIELAGSVTDQEVKISGESDYDAKYLKSANTSVEVAGTGDVVVWATTSLAVSVAGEGNVHYYGHPSLSRSVAGLGSVEGLGDNP